MSTKLCIKIVGWKWKLKFGLIDSNLRDFWDYWTASQGNHLALARRLAWCLAGRHSSLLNLMTQCSFFCFTNNIMFPCKSEWFLVSFTALWSNERIHKDRLWAFDRHKKSWFTWGSTIQEYLKNWFSVWSCHQWKYNFFANRTESFCHSSSEWFQHWVVDSTAQTYQVYWMEKNCLNQKHVSNQLVNSVLLLAICMF